MTQITLEQDDIDNLSQKTREEIQRLIFGRKRDQATGRLVDILGPKRKAELNEQQVRLLVEGLSPITIKYLNPFIHGRGMTFMKNLLEATGYEHYRQLTGITSGLTKRTQGLVGDEHVDLIERSWGGEIPMRARTPDNATYTISEQTLGSLRAVLGEES